MTVVVDCRRVSLGAFVLVSEVDMEGEGLYHGR